MKICFATQNRNKLKEIQAMLPHGIQLLTPEDLGCHEELPETQPTLEGNSLQKAEYVFKHYHSDCFADDTGLEIESLGGEPGVYSARYAGPQKNAKDNMQLVLEKLSGKPNRKAHFRSVITLIIQGNTHVFQGFLHGTLLEKERGTNGFGYDPIFVPDGYTQTLAEMSLEEKNKISHRGIAFRELAKFLSEELAQ